MKKTTKKNKVSKAHEAFKKAKRLAAPKNADWYIDLFYFKQGSHGFMFSWDGLEWIKSARTIKDIFQALESADKECFSINKKASKEIS